MHNGAPVPSEDIWSNDTTLAVEAYRALRRAILITDQMTPHALRTLAARALQAAQYYPLIAGDMEGSAHQRMNDLLMRYGEYATTVAEEKTQANLCSSNRAEAMYHEDDPAGREAQRR